MANNIEGKKPEEILSEWLAHPNEFGIAPKSVSLRDTIPASIIVYDEPLNIGIYDYEMPDGTTGRGFAFPLAWSFRGVGIDAIKDGDLLIAYCGWVFLFLGLQQGQAVTDFVSQGEEERLTTMLKESDISDLEITGRYKIGNNEFFEYSGVVDGDKIKGAGTGDQENNIIFNEHMAEYNLPPIYFLLGLIQNR